MTPPPPTMFLGTTYGVSPGLEVCLNNNEAMRGGVRVSLTSQQAVVLHTLAKKFGSVVTKPTLYKALYGSQTAVNINVVRVIMTRLRTLIAPLGISIPTIHSVGYMLATQDVTSEVTA